MTIGSELRHAREQRGASLREISDRTRIRVPVLRAIENDDFQQVPGTVIMRGFLKLYAREVGLDPDYIGRRYTAQVESNGNGGPATPAVVAVEGGPDGPPQEVSRVPLAVAAVGFAVLAMIATVYLISTRPQEAPAQAQETSGDVAPAASASAVAAPVASVPASPTATPQPQGQPAPGPAVAKTASTAPADKPAPTGTAGTSASTAASSGTLRVDLHATDACWVSVTADGQQIAFRMLNPGERINVRASNEAVVRIGIPANLSITINDRPVRPFERPGTPTTLRITPANYQQFLAR
jgi:cytoskeleton protein RodZ